MPLQLIFPNESFATMLTDVRPLTSVDKCVTSEFILAGIRFTAHNALERPLTRVDAGVNHKTFIPEETFSTGLTTEWEVVRVDPHVVL